MVTDERHITDSWLNDKFGDKQTTIIRSLLKNLEVLIAAHLMVYEGFDVVSRLVISWFKQTSEIVCKHKEQMQHLQYGISHARTKQTKESWRTIRENISYISAELQDTIVGLNRQLQGFPVKVN